jgi:protein tyrosine phosphatase (PTP) superfamily phosphohydrolase (DUF442 family)
MAGGIACLTRMTEILNFRAVDGSLATSGLPTEEQLRTIADEGFEVVINLALDNNPPYSLRGEAGIVGSLGMDYIHIPVNFSSPTAEDLEKFCDAMDTNGSRKRFVHCAMNKRASVFVGLHRVLRLKWDREAAFDLVRSLWEPDAVWQAFIEEALAKRAS